MRRLFKMPDLGEGLADAEIITWKVAVGDEVREDADLVTVETAKAVIDIPSPVDGVLAEARGGAGDTIVVGDLLAVFEDASPETPPDPSADVATTAEHTVSSTVSADSTESSGYSSPADALPQPVRRAASPAVRRRARELGVDLSTVQGSGPAGRVLEADLRSTQPANELPANQPSGPAPGETTETPLRGLRRTIARTMAAGWQAIPHMFDLREADATGLLQARDALREHARNTGNAELAAALTPLAIMVKITAVALARHPSLHGYVDEDRELIVHHQRCHLGIATATSDGLLAPVLADVDRRPLSDLALDLRTLTASARARTLTPDQLSGPTFLVNNLGALGTHFGTPLIPPGLGGNLGFGRIVERPVVKAGQLAAAQILPLSIAADHRLVDGDALAAFAGTIVDLVENPVLLLARMS